MERKGKIEQMDRSFDVAFWQKLGPEAIFAAAWEMVEDAYRWKGQSVEELTFQRSVESIQRPRR